MKVIQATNQQIHNLYYTILAKSAGASISKSHFSNGDIMLIFNIKNKPLEKWKVYISTELLTIKSITKFYKNDPIKQFYNNGEK